MNIAKNVKRPMLMPFVVPKRNPLNGRRFDLLHRLHHKNVPKALSLQGLERAAELRPLLMNDMRTKRAVIPASVAFEANLFWGIQNDGDRQAMVFLSQMNQGLRDSGCTLVASMTVSRPRARRFPAM